MSSDKTLGEQAAEQIERMSGTWGGGKSNTRAEAMLETIKIIDTLDAQRTPCCDGKSIFEAGWDAGFQESQIPDEHPDQDRCFVAYTEWLSTHLCPCQRTERLREAWEEGIRLARSYGDNIIHLEGEQKERQWKSFLGSGEPDSSSLPVAESAEWAVVSAEIEKAAAKFPTWPTDPIHAIAVLSEELGELTKEVVQLTYEPDKGSRKAVRKEAIQAAAMAIRFLASLDKYVYHPQEQHEQHSAALRRQSAPVEVWRRVHNNGSIRWETGGDEDGDLIASVEPTQANHLCAAFNKFWQRRVSAPKGGKA